MPSQFHRSFSSPSGVVKVSWRYSSCVEMTLSPMPVTSVTDSTRRLPLDSRPIDRLVHFEGIRRHVDGGQYHQAAARRLGRNQDSRGFPEERIDCLVHVRRGVQPLPSGVPIGVFVEIHRLQEQLGLVAERGIETGRVDAHGGAQLRHGSRFVAAAPEHVQRGNQSLIDRARRPSPARRAACSRGPASSRPTPPPRRRTRRSV